MTDDQQSPPPVPSAPPAALPSASERASGQRLTFLGAYFPEAGRLLAANLPLAGWLAAIYLLVAVIVLSGAGLLARIVGNPWPSLALLAAIMALAAAPLGRLTICHLALNIWDDGDASLGEAFSFARGNYLDALGAAWNGLIYEGWLFLRAAACAVPGLVVGAGLHWLLPYSGVELALVWQVLIVLALTAILAGWYLWGAARRICTFLFRFNAFEIVDGQSVFSQDIVDGRGRNWGSRFARMYHQLDQEPFPYEFNMPLAVNLIVSLTWVVFAGWILTANLQILSKVYFLIIGPLLVKFILGLWYSIAAAGYYRAYLAPEDSRYGR